MADKDLVNMIISKIDDLKDDITKSLDRHEVKIDLQTEKLNEFEVKANSVFASHETDINNLKNKVEILESERLANATANATKSSNGSGLAKYLSPEIMTWLFRFILTVFMLLVGVKSDVIQKAAGINFGPSSITVSDTIKVKK